MKKIVFINACIRNENSRTLKLAKPLLKQLSKNYEIEEINLTKSDLTPVTSKLYEERKNGLSIEDIQNGKVISNADRIVIASPFWDMSFPSVLKVFFEHISAPGLTFNNNDDGSTRGNCKAKKILYITTRGMNIETNSSLDQGTSYLKALGWLWGIPEVITVAVAGTDVSTESQLEAKFEKALEYGLSICEDF